MAYVLVNTVEEPPRAHSVMQMRSSNFQVRASQLLKKVTNFRVRGSGRKGDSWDPEGSYPRQTRSMDGRSKPYMSQPYLALRLPDTSNPTETDDSSLSVSSANSPSRHSRHLSDGMPASPSYKALSDTPHSPVGISVESRLKDGVRREETDNNITRPPLIIEGLPDIIVSGPPIPPSKEFDQRPRTPIYADPDLPTKCRRSSESVADRSKYSSSSNASKGASPLCRLCPTCSSPQANPSCCSSISKQSPGNDSTHSGRPPTLQLERLPSTSLRFHAQGDLRLSPSVIYRPPKPIRNLPPLPQSTEEIRVPSRQRLRTIPALPREGTNDDDHDSDADHENSDVGDSDEEDEAEVDADPAEGGGGSDEDEDVDGDASESIPASSRSSVISQRRRIFSSPAIGTGLPMVDTSRFDVPFIDFSSPAAGPSTGVSPGGEKTPQALHPSDYFSIRTEEPDPNHPSTPLAREGKSRQSGAWRSSQVMPILGSGVDDLLRPGIYRRASRSMVNLALGKDPVVQTPTIIEEDPIPSIGKGKGKAREPIVDHVQESSQSGAAPAYDLHIKPSITRRRSMPNFNTVATPPPYQPITPRAHPLGKDHFIQPRDDEGKEQLPPYSNSVYLAAIMPRKMEFTSPGVQSRDRKWRRVLCVLEGTAFKVYKCPSGASGAGVITEWWEDKVGVGDVTLVNGNAEPPAKKKGPESLPKWDRERREAQGGPTTTTVYVHPTPPSPVPSSSSSILSGGGSNRSRLNLAANLLKPSAAASRGHARARSDLTKEGATAALGRRHRSSASSVVPSTSLLNVATTLPVTMALGSHSSLSNPPSSLSSRPLSPRSDVPKLELIKAYTLQHAESGLGNDYVKRKNVIRVRMEGEQFLLQANDVAGVVEWIEGIHAATNIALDLDERVMPKGPMFPRRRRRRNRRADGEPQGPSEAGLPSSPT